MKKQTAKSIVIDLNDDVAVIDIHVILKYGYKIPEVSEKIQAARQRGGAEYDRNRGFQSEHPGGWHRL